MNLIQYSKNTIIMNRTFQKVFLPNALIVLGNLQNGSRRGRISSTRNILEPDKQLQESIKVSVRIRPLLEKERNFEETLSVLGDRTIIIKKGNVRTQMVFDRVFAKEATQEEVYCSVRKSIDAVVQGINATVFA